MKRFEDHVKRVMQADRTPPESTHITAFREFLVERKRKRRVLFIWIFTGLVMLAGVAGIVLTTGPTGDDLDPPGTPASGVMTEVPALSRGVMSADNMRDDVSSNSGTSGIVDPAPDTEEANSHIRNPKPKEQLQSQIQAVATISQNRKGTEINQPEDVQVVIGNVDPSSTLRADVDTKTQAQIAEDGSHTSSHSDMPRTVIPHSRLTTGPVDLLAKAVRALPVVELSHTSYQSRPEFGLTGSWFGMQPTRKANISAGTGVQLGGFLTMHLSRRWYLNAEAGFMYQDGGHLFDKQSVTTQFGFSQRSQSNRLSIRRSYAWYFGVSTTYRYGRHAIEAGAQLYHVYGARGDVARTTVESNQQPVTIELEDVWVVTDGLRMFPADLMVGYRYQLNNTLQAALRMRVPLTAIESARSDTQYDYMGNTYRFAPQFGLYYHINH